MIEDQALAICFANLKGTRNKDLLTTARALQFLKSLPHYGSNAKVGEKLNVSGEIVREFLVLLQLPEGIQELIDQRKIGLDQGRKLWRLGRDRPELLHDAAGAMADLSAIESRHLIDYMLKHPELSATEAKRQLLATQTQTEREFHVIALLSEEQYRRLERRARGRKTSTSDLVTSIIAQWLDREE